MSNSRGDGRHDGDVTAATDVTAAREWSGTSTTPDPNGPSGVSPVRAGGGDVTVASNGGSGLIPAASRTGDSRPVGKDVNAGGDATPNVDDGGRDGPDRDGAEAVVVAAEGDSLGDQGEPAALGPVSDDAAAGLDRVTVAEDDVVDSARDLDGSADDGGRRRENGCGTNNDDNTKDVEAPNEEKELSSPYSATATGRPGSDLDLDVTAGDSRSAKRSGPHVAAGVVGGEGRTVTDDAVVVVVVDPTTASSGPEVGPAEEEEEGEEVGESDSTQLLGNSGTPRKTEDSGKEEEAGGIISDGDVELMADTTGDMDAGRLENLTQSILDLQFRSEAGLDMEPAPYVRHRGLGKYSNTLKTLLPIRAKTPEDILPLSSVGCLNFATYGWVTPIIIKVFRKGIDSLKTYKLADIDSAEYSAQRLEHLWTEELERRGAEEASFRRVLLRAARTRLICTFLCTVSFVFFSLLNPIFIIRSFLEYLSQGDIEVGRAMTFVVGMLMCELLRATTFSITWMINYKTGFIIRSGAMTLLYKKILHLKGLKDKTVGELVNLVGNDSIRIFEAFAVGPLILSGPVSMAAGCTYALFYLGPWALVGCVVFVGFYPFSAVISRMTTFLRGKGINVTDKRVRTMNELLTCIKLIKMYAWEKSFAKKIAGIRLEERSFLEKSAIVQSISTGTAILVPAMASTLTFIAMVSSGNDLTAAKAFSFVALLNSMRFVLGVLPYAVKALSEVTVALKRYTKVLLMPEMDDTSEAGRPAANLALDIRNITMAWSSTPDLSTDTIPDVKKMKGEEKIVQNGKKANGGTNSEKQKMLSDEATNPAMVENSSDGPTLTLTDINFSLEKGKLLGVCGSVGSGKSSLIHAVLGRMETVSGSILVGGSVAYVPQQAWIMNATARENILFGTPFDEERYQQVVETCGLQTDFEALVSGDLTEIGERGINLSGGQKQRISLARAVYSDSDIYLLDDPLSAVDIHVGRHIFTKCVAGILAGKSIIFVTHQLQYLPHCDDIIFLKEGRIAEKGHHNSLMATEGEYATLMGIYYKEHTAELKEEEELEAALDPTLSRSMAFERTISCLSNAGESAVDKPRALLERGLSVISKGSKLEQSEGGGDVDRPPGPNGGKEGKGGQLIRPEEMMKGSSMGRGVILYYMRESGGYCATLLIAFVFLMSVTSQNSAFIFLSYWLGQGSGNTTIIVGNTTMISQSITDHPNLSTFTLIYGMIIVAMIVLLLTKAISFMKYTLKGSSAMHDDVFVKILRCPMSFFDTTPLGRIVNRFSSDMDEVDVRLPMTAEVFFSNVLHVFFSLGIICYVAPWFILVLIPLVIIFIVIFFIFTRTVRDMKRMDLMTKSPLLSHLTATVQGITVIHAYSKTKEFLKRYCELLNTNSVPFIMFFVSNRWLALRLDMLSTCVVTVTGIIIVLTYEQLTPAMAGLALSSALQMTGLFQFTVRLAIETEARFTSVQRVFEYSKTVEPEAASIVPDSRPEKGWPKKGSIAFRNVQMKYRPNLPLTLKGVSFKVFPKEKIGIVGRTGSGKSTLGVVLFRLVELTNGYIRIDDLDISKIGLEDLRSRLAIIPQDPVLFVGTVRYNLDPFNEHADENLWLALEKCHIKDAIAGLDLQLEAPVVENGENFSVGERQLLCMARALLRNSKILMLDEATAAIDTETDALVQATLKEAFSDCTMLIIAHRLNTVLACDKILVMDEGKVAEFDRPSVLMSQTESVFRSMLEASEGAGLDLQPPS